MPTGKIATIEHIRYNDLTSGTMAEWLRNGLQNRVHRFKSGWCLHFNDTYSAILEQTKGQIL